MSVRHLISALALALAVCGCGKPAPPQRIFLVTIDTLRADHLGLYGYPRATSPFIDSLGKEGLVFETAFASISHTAPSHASLFTALHPAQHGLLVNGEELHESLLTLAQLYRGQGYRTAGFTTVSFLQGLAAGFDELSYESRFHPASTILGKAREWIRALPAEEKLFVWIHLFDVHEWNQEKHVDPEALRAIRRRNELRGEALLDYLEREHGTKFGQGREKVLRSINRYDGQVLSTDQALARFFETLEGEGLADDALWVVTSDHGEGLGNHDYMGHGKTVYNEQIRVPLVFYFSDRRLAPRRVRGLVRLVDVAPTLAEVAGASFDAQVVPTTGKSLLPLMVSDRHGWDVKTVFSQRRPADAKRLSQGWHPGDVFAIQSDRHKVIAYSQGEPELYDLASDPFELHDLAGEPAAGDPGDESARMLEGLIRRYRAMAAQGRDLGSGIINPEYIEELKALGYL